MRSKKIAKYFLICLTIAASIFMAGCGATEAEVATIEIPSEVQTTEDVVTDATEEVVEASEEMSVEEVSEVSSEDSALDSEAKEGDMAAEIIDIAEKGYAATVESNYADMVKYTTLDVMYYFTEGKWISDEELIVELENAATEEGGTNDYCATYASLENLEFISATPLSQEEVDELNAFIQELGAGTEVDYVLTGAYKLPATYSNMSETEQAMIGTKNAPYMLVVEEDGEWKLDVFVSITKEMYDAFGSMAP